MLKLAFRNPARVESRREVGDGGVVDAVGGEGEGEEEPERREWRGVVLAWRRHAGLS